MKKRILVIDDEIQIQRFMKASLLAEGFDYISALNAQDGLKLAREQSPQLIVLDLGLPDRDGSWFLEQFRVWSRVPVLVLTARDEEDEKVRLFQSGANDYLSKPFGIKELIARIRVLLRDLSTISTNDKLLHCGEITLDVTNHKIWLSKKTIFLTKKEFSLLHLFLRNPNVLITHKTLLQSIWGELHTDDIHYSRILVSQLRKKIQDDVDSPRYIITEPGLGYRFTCAEQ
ncbi:response regulator [Pseudoalteromonas lipolytica]|uniref:Two-component system, OmpR family, KDP operon response regulator KdpE n=1 Tax=Pseudoalteromonas lipolytica TaxID=570156 RepID=A0ABY1GTN7_9GAMM|nr:response regulator transcription factor [Pseudoalteromonas lipolytica]MBE0351789.1 two-component system, OmpR family, KDP operon response regulator KdpE [Pseudoalteromonas lipolytica LMEB 39]SFT99734.1 two-component system, OmpR family, KDP operon response regulator KdpE [Pseudoalteromonas lipolytica]